MAGIQLRKRLNGPLGWGVAVAVIACSGGGAALAATGPQGGAAPQGPQGPAGLSTVYADSAASGPHLSDAVPTAVASVNVPAGAYLVVGRANVSNAASSPELAECSLSIDNPAEADAQELSDVNGVDNVGSFSVQNTIQLSAPGTVEMRCSSADAETSYIRLAAIKVGALH